jgi:hypothetical protein
MEWTKGRPNKEGFYWVYDNEHSPLIFVISSLGNGRFMVAIPAFGGFRLLAEEEFGDYWWYGPIEPPVFEAL